LFPFTFEPFIKNILIRIEDVMRKSAISLAAFSALVMITLPVWGQTNPTSTGSTSDRSTQLRVLPSAGSLQDEGYLLGAGDVIQVDIFDVPEYSGAYTIQADGNLNLPLVGLINVQGLTLPQASSALSQALAPIVRRPIVTINLTTPRATKVSITGAITRPGVYTLEAFTSLTTALQQAGGVTPSADLNQIQVRRPESRFDGGEQVVALNLQDLLQQGNLDQDLILRDGDQVFIPTAQQLDLNDSQVLSNATFAPDRTQPLRIAVVGEVNRPGPYTLTDKGTTGTAPRVTNAIQEAGGITQQANVREIQVRRLNPNGAALTIAVNFWELLQGGDLNQDLPLQDGDTIVIPTATALAPEEITRLSASSFSPNEITINVVGEVVNPGSIQVPPNTPLNQAILAAGGLNNRASTGSVQLLRLNPEGTVYQQAIDFDLSAGLSPRDNPALRPNDTIVVGRKGILQFGDAIETALGSFLSPFAGILSFVRLFGF
jgi:polysaccharide biosynthesis/export protein